MSCVANFVDGWVKPAGHRRRGRRNSDVAHCSQRPAHGFGGCFAAAAVLAVASATRAQEEVVVLVDGEPITSLDIQHRSKFMELSTHKPPSRQEAIDSLVDQILELREAKRYDIEPDRFGRERCLCQRGEPYGSGHRRS